MKLHYFRCAYGNFGDDLNLWFWDQVLPGWQGWQEDCHLIGIGSILIRGALPEGPKLVVGTGSGYGDLPDISGPDWDIRGVRGPLTCARLGLSPELSLSDPAILLPRLSPFTKVAKTDETLFVPHISSDLLCDWSRLCAGQGIRYQSPSAPALDVIARIAGARRVIAESMHAAIIADAFGVPWRAVAISNAFNLFKWNDWAASLDQPALTPQRFFGTLRRVQTLAQKITSRRLGPAAPRARAHPAPVHARMPSNPSQSPRKPYLEWLARSELGRAAAGAYSLTDRKALARQQDRIEAVLDQIRQDYAPHGAAGTQSAPFKA